jgi:hypothetical protein
MKIKRIYFNDIDRTIDVIYDMKISGHTTNIEFNTIEKVTEVFENTKTITYEIVEELGLIDIGRINQFINQ